MDKIGIWEDAEPGVRRKILNAGKQLMMMEVHFKKGAEGNEHRHVHEQLTYCVEGKMKFFIDGKEAVIEQGDTVLIPSNVLHSCIALEESKIIDAFNPIREDLLQN